MSIESKVKQAASLFDFAIGQVVDCRGFNRLAACCTFKMQFFALTILGFISLEALSYPAHRWLFHGVLWRIHRTHHVSRTGWFELNDIFSVFFAAVSMFLLVFAEQPIWGSIAFPVGLGIAAYGVVYFIAHDFFTHRRFLPFGSKNRVLLTIRSAHQKHHQTTEKDGIEPFGLFVFNFRRFWRKDKLKRMDKTYQDA